MLKWTVSNRRDSVGEPTSIQRHPTLNSCSSTQRRSIDAIRERKQRRRSSRRASLCLRSRNDKENQCHLSLTSTPNSNKLAENYSGQTTDTKVLRDVSNITPKTHLNTPHHQNNNNNHHKRLFEDTQTLSPQVTQIRKKKQCLDPTHQRNHEMQEIKRILLNQDNVNDHQCTGCEIIPGLADNFPQRQPNNLASTLPSFRTEYIPGSLRNLHNPQSTIPKNAFPYQSLSTIPQFRAVLQETGSPTKKPKIDHVNDFLHQISFITSPEDFRIRNPKIDDLQVESSEINVSPLLRKISDLRFSKIHCCTPVLEEKEKKVPTQIMDDSSAFNDMSLDKIVDAILDTTSRSEMEAEANAGNRLAVDETEKPQRDNEINEINEDNLVNNQKCSNNKKIEDTTKRKRTLSCSEINSIRPNPIQSMASKRINLETSITDMDSKERQLESNKVSKGRCLDSSLSEMISTERYLDSSISEMVSNGRHQEFKAFERRCLDSSITEIVSNERCLDSSVSPMVSNGMFLESSVSEVVSKRRYLESSISESSFILRRQKCVRRRKTISTQINNNLPTELDFNTPTSALKESSPIDLLEQGSNLLPLNDNSFSSSCMSTKNCTDPCPNLSSQHSDCLAYSSWEKDMCCGLSTPFLERLASKNIITKRKRMLKRSMSSPITVAASSTPTRRDSEVCGTVDLGMMFRNGKLTVHVFRCKDLSRGGRKPINAYVKVYLGSDSARQSSVRRPAGPQRTAVQAGSYNPSFDHQFSFAVSKTDLVKKIIVEVWHRDRGQKRSEFLGCLSFPVKNAVKKDVNGSFKLSANQQSCRSQNEPITRAYSVECTNRFCDSPLNQQLSTIVDERVAMGENSQSSVEEVVSIDDIEGELTRRPGDKNNVHQHQKDADENLFLRYLELDPMDGPEAVLASQQKKAIGNKCGRTPFTQTKRLTRGAKSGFGFSVVWTHPPRIERVEKNMPADKAGILPGDYIIFVDKHNVVMMPEIDILNLIRSFGSTLTLEIFRRSAPRNGSIGQIAPVTPILGSKQPQTQIIATVQPQTQITSLQNQNVNGGSEATCAASVTFQTQHRPSTGCSNNTAASVDYSRRTKLHLPQVTFTAEKPSSTPDEARKRAMYQLINKEQQYATALQFAVTRFVSALSERKDLITPQDHHWLFQNAEELLRITEDIIEALVLDDGEPQIQLLPKTYESKLYEITTAYKRYCAGIKKADCVLAAKTKNSNSEFVRFLQSPTIPRRRPDITSFIHRPLEHYRDILKLLSTILSNTKSNQEDYSVISHVVNEMQTAYREITSECGLMEPVGGGRPLLSVQDLENRLVFTKCKPFVLSKPGRQWIFGGDLSRVEGRTIRTYWALLFSDLILFAKVSRDRVLFITEEPLPLAHVSEIYFNIRKKATEFRITVDPGGKKAHSPTVHCGPDLSRTPRKNSCKRCVVLRAPTLELKAVWQNLLQRQLYQVNCGLETNSMSSPMDSPDIPITCSGGTYQSAESLALRRQAHQQFANSSVSLEMQKHLDELIEHKCKQISKTCNNKGGAIHLEQWMKNQLGCTRSETPEYEPEPEVWTEEELRIRTAELKLSDCHTSSTLKDKDDRCEELILSDHDQSPSRSTTTESQVTVKSSPVVPEQVSLCKQCHETCLSNNNSPNLNVHHTNNNVIHNKCHRSSNNSLSNTGSRKESLASCQEEDNEWGSLMLLGLAAINPTTSLVKVDPFAPKAVPQIAVVPPTPDQGSKSITSRNCFFNDVAGSPLKKRLISNLNLVKDHEESPDDSPQNEPPYYALGNCNAALKRYGTLSSLEKLTSDELSETLKNTSESESDDEEHSHNTDPGQTAAFTSSFRSWTARAGNYVSEKMAFFERFTDDTPSGGFFDRYLRSKAVEETNHADEEASGATSGEEIWGTPTSGGELEDPLSLPNSDGGQLSPQSPCSINDDDDTELMMDELLMAPPVISSAMRGLLPRRRLEPLMEEDDTDTYSSSSSTSEKVTPSPEEGYGTGVAADNYSDAAQSRFPDSGIRSQIQRGDHVLTEEAATVYMQRIQQTLIGRVGEGQTGGTPRINAEEEEERIAFHSSPARSSASPTQLPRSRSYRNIQEVEETTLFNRFPLQSSFQTNNNSKNTDSPPQGPKNKLLEFFSAKRSERRVHESFQNNKPAVKVFSKEEEESKEVPNAENADQKPLSPMLNKDKQLDRRFWRQLSKRRKSRPNQVPA